MKKLIIFFAFLLVAGCLMMTASKSLAQTNSQPIQAPVVVNPYMVPNTAPGVPQNLHTFVPALMNEIIASMVCLLSGTDPITKTNNCLGVTPNGKLGYTPNQQGVSRLMASTLDSLYNEGFPISTGTYIAYLRNNFGIVRQTYADPPDQSSMSGYQGLSPLINIWLVIRNIAYLLIVIAFMGIGIAVMLRVKIDPRTVMTIENQLPKLIIGLILITFSFAIAGLMVDTMKIVDGVIFNLYTSIKDPNINTNINWDTSFQNANPWEAINILIPAKGIPIDTTSIQVGNQGSFNLPSLDSLIPQPVKDYVVIGGVVEKLIDLVNLVFTIPARIDSLITGNPFQVTTYNGIGKGIENLAGAAATSFGGTLSNFLQLQQTQPNPVTMSIQLIGPFVGTITSILNDFQQGSAVGAIIDVASSILAFNGANHVSNWAAQTGANLTGIGTGGGLTTGIIFGLPAFVITYNLLFNTIDYVLRNWGLPIIIWLIVYLAIFLATAKLFFGLVVAWSSILFKVIIGPILIVFGLIPGVKGTGVSSWLKSLAADLAAFPVTIGILLLGSALVQAITPATNFFIPPLVGNGQIQIGLLMAITVIFAASNGPQIAKDLFEEKDNKNFGGLATGLGQSSKIATGSVSAMSEYTAPIPGGGGAITGPRAIIRQFFR